MDAFVSRKRRRLSPPDDDDQNTTEFKLALLASLNPGVVQDALLDALVACEGNLDLASAMLSDRMDEPSPRKKISSAVGHQSSLASLLKPNMSTGNQDGPPVKKTLTRKGKTLFLYSPQDIETHTPCSIIHNFLPALEAESLLQELLDEAITFEKSTFQLFDRTVESPHSMAFFVNSIQEVQDQKTSYVYNGSRIRDIRQSPPQMLKVSDKVAVAVNAEIERRINSYHNGKKLKYQSTDPWRPNTAFVNCYNGPQESVGFHSDQLTYLGPRAVIGSLSLGVAREFRVRRVVATTNSKSADKNDNDEGSDDSKAAADLQGQVSIHLPHNSLLVMHSEMQEQWKHSIAPANAIDPHPIAGNKRINITYRYYKDAFHPRFTPKCACGVPTVLRCVQRKAENLGRYMWMCHSGYTPGQRGCSFFKWAEFDDNGEPPWKEKVKMGSSD